MKKATKLLSVALAILLSVSLFTFSGCSKSVSAEKDLTKLSWDQIVQEAKSTKKLVFTAWWGEEYFKPAVEEFSKKYGIEVELIKADHKDVVNKLLAEQGGTSSIDCFLLGGESVLTAMKSDLLYGPLNTLLPESDKMDPTLFSIQEGVLTKGNLVPMYRNQTGLLYDSRVNHHPPADLG